MTATAGHEAALPAGDTAAAPDADGFHAHFLKHIAPHFDALEKKRLVLKSQYLWRLAVAGAGTLGALLVAVMIEPLLHSIDKDAESFLFLPFFTAIGLLVWARRPRNRYVRSYKETLLPAVADYFGEFSYDTEGGISMSRLNGSTLIPSHDRYRHEDLFTGCYRDVDVQFCEACLTQRRGSSKNRRTVTVFAGVFVLLTMNKDFKGRTVVRRDAGKLGNWLEGTFSKLEPVKLEDPEFERQFEVYSDDQVEARYLLTPAFMTRLTDLSRVLATRNLEAAFFGARLMIKLPTQLAAPGTSLWLGPLGMLNLRFGGGSSGLFEPGSIFSTARDVSRLNRIVGQFRSILSIIDVLRLYERTGL